MMQAWHTGYFTGAAWAGKLPSLQKVMRAFDSPAQVQKINTPERMLEWAKAFAQTYGRVKKRGEASENVN